ncbi:MAG: HlyC/CorC family transporter [Planctomycetes bacterium]|nr:HlyC/CorC family transporter [Planctomycetota bacterium]
MLADQISRLLVLAVTFCLSAFFSGSETALFSLAPHELAHMREGAGLDRLAASLRERPRRLLTTVLFGNMLVNVIFFSVSFYLAMDLRPEIGAAGSMLIGAGSLALIIVGGEVMPKNVAVLLRRPISRFAAPALFVMERLFWVVVAPLGWLAGLVTARGGISTGIETEELEALLDIGARQGVLDRSVGRMIGEVFALAEVSVREIMIPRADMVAFDLEDRREELLQMFRREKLTMIPVYEGRMENMRGMVHVKDILFKSDEVGIREMVRPLPFIPENATVEQALRRCREEGSQSAFVVDEYGSVAGLLTLEDLAEEIVGEIRDEYDYETPPLQPLGGGRYRVMGRVSLRDWCEVTGASLPDVDVDSVGGLVTALLGRVPEAGEEVLWRGQRFSVESVSRRRVRSLLAQTGAFDSEREDA